MPDILHLVTINAAPERVYEALTTAEGIRHWWTREAELEPRVGGSGEFRFYEGKSVTKIRIDELASPKRVRWTTVSSDAPGDWNHTSITFDLRPEGSGTVVSFAHRGFKHESDGYALVNTGWAYYLVSLRQYLETGDGAPQQDKDFSILLRERRNS